MISPALILVLDDNPDDRALAVRALRAEFPEARYLEVGTESGFHQAFAQGGFDAVVTDYQLKWSDGLQVLKAIRRSYPEVPVVMFTNTGTEEVCAAAMREGAHDYILKKANHYVMLPAAVRTGLAVVNARRVVREQQAALQAALASEREARERAERADRLKDEFLATLSHELRTPLNAILGWTQVLQRAPENAETVAQGARVIERNVKTQARLIEDLLDVSSIISGKLRLETMPVELLPVVEAALEAVAPTAQSKGVRLERRLDTGAGPVLGDATRLQQVFWNILVNAVKFTPSGGRVRVALERVGEMAQVTITDTGEGISPDFLPHMFDRLRQADGSTTRRHGGLGLGLSIVKHLVELHGGTVHGDSPGPGQGASFVVRLPLAPVAERRRVAPEPSSAEAGVGCVSLAGVRVLAVDDEPDARDLLRKVLEDCGAQVQVAASAREALALFAESSPDILVCDIGMPAEDGYALISQVRKLEGDAPRVPAIALTAFARAEDRRRALLAGFQLHLAKPVEADELVVAVASQLGRTGA
ncbi:hybrid sensor histidine kinase/response regulator [Ramlibacter tataouinensis]|uniref:Virulence sensor protein BvgS n=1 Tax=Ramlibacter tataouinensis (strain ATCC BAA-407 / DSM 14655 / LMG 21543 / TTB310) TaxID=365046 RepID=F5XWR7_RAMTT|nr:hybrid sensor histidine kinase/response regulator [Ramlibacter tataouinensis]AEG94211.1 candidate histidine kinase, atypical hybrid [Ramlibacter tataouinensis TTB310]